METISTKNGNLMMHLPLVSLPPGRGGLSGKIGLFYNSKLWEAYSTQIPDQDGNPATVEYLRQSADAGWRYGLNYSLTLLNLNDYQQGGGYCYYCEGLTCSAYPNMYYIYKLQMSLPDGSTHVFHSRVYPEYGGYSRMRPDGWQYDCPTGDQPAALGTMVYYTDDGSYLRLEVAHDGDANWSNNPWTLYMPDGSRVTGGSGPQRIYDRNNNYIEIRNTVVNNNPATEVVDQLGRALTIEYDYTNDRDFISQRGTNNEEIKWTVQWNYLYVYKTCWAVDLPNGFVWEQGGVAESIHVVRTITLPIQEGSQTYDFSYNADPATSINGWGELSSMTLPTGAKVNYSYEIDGLDLNNGSIRYKDVLANYPTRKVLSCTSDYDGTSSPTTETWTYNAIRDSTFGSDSSFKTFETTSPDGGINRSQFSEVQWLPTQFTAQPYRVENPDGSVVERSYRSQVLPGTPVRMAPPPSVPGSGNSYLKTEFRSIRDAAGNLTQTAIKDYDYDKNGNVTRVTEYDWVAYASIPRDGHGRPTGTLPTGAPLKRITTNGYYNQTPDASNTTTNDPNAYYNSSSPQLRNTLSWNEVSDGAQTLARTELVYDNPSITGNLTQKLSWDSTKGSYSNPLTASNSISTSNTYDSYGNLLSSTDARGVDTTYCYSTGDCAVSGQTANLYPTRIQVASNYSSLMRTTNKLYDFATGLVTSVTDADNSVTTSTSHDVFGRPTLVKAADGVTGTETDTVTIYSDVDRRVIVKSDLNTTGDGKLVSIQHYDQLGRVRLSRQLEDSTNPNDAYDETIGIKVQTRYLFSGSNSYTLSSNPYRAATSQNASSETTMGWTRSMSDNSGRMVEVQTFGGSSLPGPWGSSTTSTGTVTTAYDANFTTVTDQAGKPRRSMTNGLGQLARVDEPGDPSTNNSLGTTDNPAQPTSYDYDALGNLLHVYQGSQTRTFTYSSLARLLTAMNPESGTICYGTVSNGQCQANGYDENGNSVYKTDARGVQANYVYDRLNRATSRTYSDGTPTVTYAYDTVSAYGKGRLASVSSSVSSYSYSAYDALGRALGGTQTISSHDYSITNVAYDRAGHVTSMTYPSGHSVTFNYDNAGRLSDKDSSHLAFTGNLGGGGNSRTYSSITGSNAYDAAGHLTQEQFGTAPSIYNKLNYNPRGQLIAVLASTSGNDTTFNRGKIVNDYGTTDNNGNLKQQTVYVPNDQNTSPTSWYQQYGYDSLNRLTQVHEYTGNTALDWQQAYSYDRWGNRLINNNSSATWGDGINNVVATVDPISNQMYASGDTSLPMNQRQVQYDFAGNQTKDNLTSNGTRTYDAENRMITATDSSNHTSTYSYDGDSHRVKRNISNTETWQVYGLGGELIAEYAKNGSYLNPQKEYGYRNGQLLVTATATTGWGTAPTLNDNPLSAGQTTVQARHITELRTAIDALRSHMSLSPFSWQYSATTNDYISANPILEMRTALDQALGAPSGGYATGLAQGQPVQAIHIQELRDRVLGAWTSGSGVDLRWMVSDQLGTPRMIFDQSGSLASVSRHDYLPFGEELNAQGLRPNVQGYTNSDGARQKFTQKERDIETGLDYFLARYYSSTQGRFTSPDEFKGGPVELFEEVPAGNPTFYADLTDPQSLNKYQYAYNNPLRYVDPDGHQGKETVNNILSYGGQVIKDTAIGGGKGVANAAVGVPNTINLIVNTAMSPFTNARFDYLPTFEPSTPGEKGAMFAVQVVALIEGARGANATGAAMVDSSRTAAMTQEMRASETTSETIRATVPYERPSGATTAAQRASVQGLSCSTCRQTAARMFADHKTPLVKEHYLTGTIDRVRMRSLSAVRPQCPTCSGRQGATLGQWGRQQRAKLFEIK